MAKRIPIVRYLALDDGPPHLRADECASCGARYLDRRNACARCGRQGFVPRPLSCEGTLSSFSIVHQTAAKVPVPFVSAIVELSGGDSVKSTLVNVEPSPKRVRLGMRVEMTTYVAATDDEGTEAIAFAFQPVDADRRAGS